MNMRVGVLTGGGDCPGLNAVIRAVTKSLIHHGHCEVLGIADGFEGLMGETPRARPLVWDRVSGILHMGGTILGTSNSANPLKDEATLEQVRRNVRALGLDVVVAIGGDGTMSLAHGLQQIGLACVGVPKTIDNDIAVTEITFGFQTAVATATDALDRCRTTADSHHRALVVEVMGRNAGWIALHAGVAAASDVILLPEIPFSMTSLYETVLARAKMGKRSSIICVSEGALPEGGKQVVAKIDPTSPDPIRLGGIGKVIADLIEKDTDVESRHVVLGHVQRGGTPVASDRVLSTLLGNHAMTLLREGKVGRMVAVQKGCLTDVDLEEPAGKQRRVPKDEPLLQAAKAVGTSFAD